MRKEYTGAASPLTLRDPLTAVATSFTALGTATGWPTGADAPFVVELDRGENGLAEKILCSARDGNTFTVAGSGRGYDGTTAESHSAGATVEHVVDALTIDEANAHANDTDRDDHTQYLNTTRHDTTARHSVGDVVPAGVPGSSAPGDSASEGAANEVARADHRHEREDWGEEGDYSTLTVGASASAGSTGRVADAGHTHAMPAAGAPVAITFNNPGSTGDATTFALSDHEHPTLDWYDAPSGSEPGDAAAEGVSERPARGDHVHGREYYPNVTVETAQDISDQGVAIGDSATIATDTFTVGTGGRLAVIHFDCDARRQSGSLSSFAGNIQIKIDGTNSGLAGRVDSDGKDVVCHGHAFTMAALTAGSHTITVVATCDPGADTAIYYYDRALTTGLIGG